MAAGCRCLWFWCRAFPPSTVRAFDDDHNLRNFGNCGAVGRYPPTTTHIKRIEDTTRNTERSFLSPSLHFVAEYKDLPVVVVVVRILPLSIRTNHHCCYWMAVVTAAASPHPPFNPPNERANQPPTHPSIHSLPSPPPNSPSYISSHPLPLMPFRYCRRSVSSFSVLLVMIILNVGAVPALPSPGSVAAVESF